MHGRFVHVMGIVTSSTDIFLSGSFVCMESILEIYRKNEYYNDMSEKYEAEF